MNLQKKQQEQKKIIAVYVPKEVALFLSGRTALPDLNKCSLPYYRPEEFFVSLFLVERQYNNVTFDF